MINFKQILRGPNVRLDLKRTRTSVTQRKRNLLGIFFIISPKKIPNNKLSYAEALFHVLYQYKS